MKLSALLLALLLAPLLVRPAVAQDDNNGPSAAQGSDEDHVPADKDEGGSAAMSPDDARMNFASVVDAFIAARSPNGYWPLKEKSTGKVLRLIVISKDPKTVHAHDSNSAWFIGEVVLRDQKSGDTVKTEFTVDFSGSEWKVKGMKITGKTPAKKKAAK